jgi:hypothetical protein
MQQSSCRVSLTPEPGIGLKIKLKLTHFIYTKFYTVYFTNHYCYNLLLHNPHWDFFNAKTIVNLIFINFCLVLTLSESLLPLERSIGDWLCLTLFLFFILLKHLLKVGHFLQLFFFLYYTPVDDNRCCHTCQLMQHLLLTPVEYSPDTCHFSLSVSPIYISTLTHTLLNTEHIHTKTFKTKLHLLHFQATQALWTLPYPLLVVFMWHGTVQRKWIFFSIKNASNN